MGWQSIHLFSLVGWSNIPFHVKEEYCWDDHHSSVQLVFNKIWYFCVSWNNISPLKSLSFILDLNFCVIENVSQITNSVSPIIIHLLFLFEVTNLYGELEKVCPYRCQQTLYLKVRWPDMPSYAKFSLAKSWNNLLTYVGYPWLFAHFSQFGLFLWDRRNYLSYD